MAIARGDTATTTLGSSWANGATAAFTKPANVANGDVLLWTLGIVSSTASADDITGPAGWVTAVPRTLSGSASIAAAYKVITNAAGEPSTYSFTQNTGFSIAVASCGAGIVRYTGVDTANVLDATSTVSSFSNSTSWLCPSITTVTANTMLVGMARASGSIATATSAVWSTVYDLTESDGIHTYVGDKAQAATGATGTLLWTGSSKQAGVTATMALRPAVAAVAIPELVMAPPSH